MVAGSFVPILVCNPASGTSVADVLEFLEHYAPGAALIEVHDIDGTVIEPDPAGDLVATVFNVKADAHVGKVCIARVFRGTLSATSLVVGPRSQDKGEKLGGLFHLVGARKREPVDVVGPGAIVAFSKVESIAFGESFTTAGKKLVRMPFGASPTPMVTMAIEPKSRADEQKIGEA